MCRFFVYSVFFVLFMQDRIQEQNLHLLDNSVKQVHMTIKQSFEGDIQLLRGVAVSLGEMDLDNRDALAAILEDINYSNEFIRMSFYEPNDLTFATDAEWQRFFDTLASDGDGFFEATVHGERQVVTLNYLGVEYFSLLGITPYQTISWHGSQTVWGAFFLVLAACAIFALLLIIQRLTMQRNQKALESMAYVDRLTGIRNYLKFERDVKRLRG